MLLPSLVLAAQLKVQVRDNQGNAASGAVVFLESAAAAAAVQPAPLANIVQRDKTFVPEILVIPRGTAVTFPNEDTVRHHVYSFSAIKPFEIKLYVGTPAAPVLFDQSGVAVLGCNIHDWMVGYIYVTDDPWFAVSDATGTLHLDALPAGRYQVTLWHPQMTDLLPQAGADIEVPAAGLQLSLPVSVGSAAVATPPVAPASAFGEAFKKAVDEDR